MDTSSPPRPTPKSSHICLKNTPKEPASKLRVIRALTELRGLYAFAVISADDPQKIVAVREGAPLIVGWVDGEGFVASDVPAVLPYTRSILFLDDHEVAVVATDGVRLMDDAGNTKEAQFQRITWDPIQAEKGGFKHFMLKEIYEQPDAVANTVLGRMSLDSGTVHLQDAALTPAQWKSFKQICILGCGTSWHSALAGKYMIEEMARIPVEVDYASEYRYRNPVILPDTLFLVITQSGETADTVAAQRLVRDHGGTILTITNVVGSMATRIADAVLYTRAGPEIGVASTKAFTTAAHLSLSVGAASWPNSRQDYRSRVTKGDWRTWPNCRKNGTDPGSSQGN